jgi:hypothetical protein
MAVELADVAVDTGDHVVQFYEQEQELRTRSAGT